MKTSNLFNLYSNFISLNSIRQHNRITNTYTRILDLFLSTDHFNVVCQQSQFPLVPEDPHHPALNSSVSLSLQENISVKQKSEVIKFNFYKANLQDLYAAVSSVQWSFIESIEDVDVACDYLYKIIFDLFDQHVPKCSVNTKRAKYPAWFTKSIIDKINEKKKHWNLYRKNKELYHINKVKNLRRAICSESRNEYLRFVNNSENSIKYDPKKFWSFVKTKTKSHVILNEMTYGDDVVTSPQEIVNAFAYNFSTVFCDNNVPGCDNNSDMNTNICDICGDNNCVSISLQKVCNITSVLHLFSINDDDIL
ncbi:hypothetical protein Zmor_007804 [Zophobas morio]|uniref:Uncharacterized protein n=1 Tax=Zophobas morio TaxID=2755281 RepID=A0AA38IT00_9CUCU|nr:hypothetical protein Zmor_007804 [Zophobas morio]